MKQSKLKKITIAAAKRHFEGNASALARFLGIKRQAVYQWRGRYVPQRHQKRLRRKMAVA